MRDKAPSQPFGGPAKGHFQVQNAFSHSLEGRTALKESDQGSGNQPSARNWIFDTIPAGGQSDGLFGGLTPPYLAKPTTLHCLEKLRVLDRQPAGGADHGVDLALGAYSCASPFVEPPFDLNGLECR